MIMYPAIFHKQKNDALGPRRKVRRTWSKRIGRRRLLAQHGGERQVAEPNSTGSQQLAARDAGTKFRGI